MIRLAVAALLLVAPAATTTTPTSETFTTVDHSAGVAFDWTVPEGVELITVTATGGHGGASDPARPGGRGAVVTVAIAVEPGQVLSITLGADGQAPTGGAGFGAGGDGIDAGGGGGSTGILIDGAAALVAAGGGGSATWNSAGGGGAGGTPDGQPGSRRGGGGGAGGVGGLGVAPWGEPGGASVVGGGGTVNGTEAGAGGGAGYGGGGAGGAYGDGGGGGSYSAIATAAFSSRLDDLTDGWVQIDYLLPAPEVVAPPVAPAVETPTVFGVDRTLVGMAAGALAVLFVVSLIVARAVRLARKRS